MHALRIYAGPKARLHLEKSGLAPEHVGVVPGAAGGPKGLILGPIDRLLFGHWLRDAPQTIHLIGASTGAWRMGTACLRDPVAALQRECIAVADLPQPTNAERGVRRCRLRALAGHASSDSQSWVSRNSRRRLRNAAA